MKSDKRPNLLVVFADQMRGMDMGCAGNPDVITPSMDRLAREGMRFTSAYANAPVCTPSRGSLLTGLYPLSHGAIANDLPMREDISSIAKILKMSGYRTGYVGKWHLDGVPRDKFTPPGPRRHGFDFWAAWECSHNYYGACYYRDTPEPIRIEGYEPIGQTDIALVFLRERDERPFCLFLSWGPPHDPYHLVPQEYRRRYDSARLALRPNVRPIVPGPRDISRRMDPRETLANYYAAITALDEQLGRILHALDELDLAEDTIVVFTSDHGDMLWSQGMMKKQQPWEESINIPFLIRWPGRIPAGQKCNALLSIVDITPSLLGLLGIEVPCEPEGSDLSPIMLGSKSEEGPDSVFLMDIVTVDEGHAQGLREWRGVRTARYTYARWVDGEKWLLYDNEADPYQLRNLAREPGYDEISDELEAILRGWLKRARDPFLPGEEHISILGLADLWNARELYMNPGNPRLLSSPTTGR